MNETQRADVGAELVPLYEEQARARHRANAGDRKSASANLRAPIAKPEKAADAAARAVNVSPRLVESALSRF